jgi:hypothetical protein
MLSKDKVTIWCRRRRVVVAMTEARLAAERRPSGSPPWLNGRRSARLAYTTTTWRIVVVGGRMLEDSKYTVMPRALGFNVGPLSLKVVLADLESCVTSVQNDTAIHFLYTVTLDHFQDLIDRKNIYASQQLLPCHALIPVYWCSLTPHPSIEISYTTAWLWLGNKQPIHCGHTNTNPPSTFTGLPLRCYPYAQRCLDSCQQPTCRSP